MHKWELLPTDIWKKGYIWARREIIMECKYEIKGTTVSKEIGKICLQIEMFLL